MKALFNINKDKKVGVLVFEDRLKIVDTSIPTFDILNEIDKKGRLRDVVVGGYVKHKIEKPPIFHSEELAPNCKFVSFRVHFIGEQGREKKLTKGELVVYVPNDLVENDFYEFRGTLSLAGFDYTRVVTMMRFKKKEVKLQDKGMKGHNRKDSYKQEYPKKENKMQYVWEVHPVSVSDLDLGSLSSNLYHETMQFIQSPLSYTHKKLNSILETQSSRIDTDKYYYDFSTPIDKDELLKRPTKDSTSFEEENNYIIDKDYGIILEALEYPVLLLNLEAFGLDKTMLNYMIWLVDGALDVYDSIEDLQNNKINQDYVVNEQEGVLNGTRRKVVLVSEPSKGYPYLELKKGDMISWGL
ncbi:MULTISPECIES: hypothetical protein [Bacillus cereus group]|uniref:hypothetical protein n=1 Tax=Bacillus cereus group TaxID=86661 RepID=UPI00005B4694|nr:hypothetical protein [Bacillus thuringiensis]EAO56482.1 hypothetical protein RBTH_07456 [Bacillus thuringiensis serovar israelensis ATCC 35646]MED1153550.1 hypothetical protein [Bacillus paranthracis]MCR6819532.1 hypothetical protein [Bacillus thuringiensis]MED3028143.1 hypothetical protein [Bacillus thuringiensis]MED3193897.1 hypothetical protein [Bacillus thuringiensis]